MCKIVRKYAQKYPFSACCIVVIWLLSLTPFFPETPLDEVAFIDKWTHLVMYGGTCAVIGWEYWRQHLRPDYEKMLFWGWLVPIMMSGVIELLQEYCTGGHRSGDWIDLAANATGATLGAVVSLLLVRCCPRG